MVNRNMKEATRGVYREGDGGATDSKTFVEAAGDFSVLGVHIQKGGVITDMKAATCGCALLRRVQL